MIKLLSLYASLFHYGILLLFGVFVSAAFLGVLKTRKDYFVLTISSAILIVIQLVLFLLFDFETVQKLYPLITHLPLVLFFIAFYKKRVFASVLSVTITYLCCQLVHWPELAVKTLGFHSIAVDLSASILLILLAVLLILFVAPPISKLLDSAQKSLFVFSIVPFVYYIYYYCCAVYTDLLFTSNLLTVEFFPFIICFAYLLFGTIYFKEYESRIEAANKAQMLKMQMAQYEALQSRMEETRRARHDLRQHLHLIQAYIQNGNEAALSDYIRTYGQSLPEDTLERYCENTVVDTLIRFYAQKAANAQITFETNLHLPEELNISEPDLCVLIGNLLENALEECDRHVGDACSIKIIAQIRGSRTLIFTVDNSPAYEPKYLNGTLLSSKSHKKEGIGTFSIKSIAARYHGEASFEWKENVFYASVVLRLPVNTGS